MAGSPLLSRPTGRDLSEKLRVRLFAAKRLFQVDELSAPTFSRPSVVSTIVSTIGRNGQPSVFSAFSLASVRTLPSSKTWPRTSASKRPTKRKRTSQSGSFRVGTFAARSPNRVFVHSHTICIDIYYCFLSSSSESYPPDSFRVAFKELRYS
jgi:hypothetical protein